MGVLVGIAVGVGFGAGVGAVERRTAIRVDGFSVGAKSAAAKTITVRPKMMAPEIASNRHRRMIAKR